MVRNALQKTSLFQNLRTKVEQYEQLCFSVDQVMEHFPSPQVVLEASYHSNPGEMASQDDRLLSLFVDNVILKAQVAVQQECKWMEPCLPSNTLSKPPLSLLSPPETSQLPKFSSEHMPLLFRYLSKLRLIREYLSPTPIIRHSHTSISSCLLFHHSSVTSCSNGATGSR